MNDELTSISDEVELISDGDGLAIIGPPAEVDRFVATLGLPSKEMALGRLGKTLSTGSAAAQAGSEVAANAGRWMKLADVSAKVPKASLITNSATGNLHATARGAGGQFTHNLQFVNTLKNPAAMLTNPALLAGAAGLMAQLAMQQTMEEITDYLAVIDAKVDDVLRAQKDAALAEMIGVAFVLEEAGTIREHVGRVSDITWSKVQATSTTIARTQAYALRQLDAIAEKLEKTNKAGDLSKIAEDAETQVEEWLAVLARCFQLQSAIGVLELDRVLDAEPEELEKHRVALKAAHHNRRDKISHTTNSLLARMDAAASRANSKVLFAPFAARSVVQSSNRVAADVVEFHARLGIEQSREDVEARKWSDAAADARDDIFEAGAEGMGVAVRVGGEAIDNIRTGAGKFFSDLGERLLGDDDNKNDSESGDKR